MTALPDRVIALVGFVADDLADGSRKILKEQASQAFIVHESPGRMLEVRLPPDVPVLSVGDGPLPPATVVDRGDRTVGEFIVWVKGGRLDLLERPWFTDEAPDAWPDVSQLRYG